MKKLLFIGLLMSTLISFGQNHIVGYEYWFDDDYSSKTSTTVAPVSQLNLNANVSTSTLNAGAHTISFRSWDENGQYSSVLTQFFYKMPEATLAVTKELVEYEYWFDDDYGTAVVNPIANQQIFNLSSLVSTTGLNPGAHSFSIRFKDNSDEWSSVLTQFFYKIPEATVAVNKELVEYEYWFDDDYGTAVVNPIANQQIFNLSSLVSTTGLNPGVHSFSIRFKDNSDMWSSVLTQFFYKVPEATVPVNKELVEYEYWFDDDYGTAVVNPIANQQIFNLSSLVSTTGLNPGVHSFSIRFKDNVDVWSSVVTQFFYKMPEETVIANNKVTNYRYWFDSDFAGVTNVTLSNPVHQLSLIDDLDLTQLPHGMHSVHFQFRDSTGVWSAITTDSVDKVALPIAEFTYSTSSNCDSTVVSMTDHSIDADEYLWDFGGGNVSTLENPQYTFYSDGVHPITLTVTDTILSIDSTITSFVTVHANTSSLINVEECANYTSPSGLYTWSASGVYYDTIPNASGCDSLMTIDLTLNNSTSSITETACSSYTAPDGAVYTSSGTYSATIPNVAGCDSLITIDLTLNNSTSSIIETACSSYTAPDGTVYTSSGTYTATIPNAAGCDSLITIDLTLNNSASSITETACSSYTAPDGVVYTSSGTYTATIPNTLGCDSLITIDLTVDTVNVEVTQNGIELTANASTGTYQWLDCGNSYLPITGEMGPDFTATANGSYAVEVTQNGCTDTSSCFVVSTIGVIENPLFASTVVYPNPTNGKVIVKFGKPLKNVKLKLYDAQGRCVFNQNKVEAQELNFDIDQPTGIYFLKIQSNDEQARFRIVKK